MIVLKADKELSLTFQKLIKMMDVPVEWNGMFFVIGDYLILQGSVRSLFFNFDTKLVVTNIIELKAEEQTIVAVEEHPNVRDILNMVLYAFGKWGHIKGLRVDKDYVQLNRLFAQILGEFQVESQYGPEHFRFYKNKIRLTYEDVIEAVLSDEPEEVLLPEEEEPQGLWHKLVWKKAASSFLMRDTTLAERRRNRIGNNFYLAGYLCPKCGSQLYMAVYPEGREFQIETEEGAVRIARVYSCKKCCCMYTPRPKRLLVDGDVYKMDFERDEAAYEDYQELLGHTAGRNVNTKYNEYVDKKMAMEMERADASSLQDEETEITELIEHLPEVSEQELFRTLRKMEEGFYSDEGVKRLEKAIRGEDEMVADADCNAEDEKEADAERAAEDESDTELEHNAEESGKTKKNVDKSDGKSERTFGKPGRDSGKTRENAPVTAGKSSGISHADLEKAKANPGTTIGKIREDSSAITGKAKEKVIDKTQKKTEKTVEKTNGTSIEETQSVKEKTERAKDAEQTFERSPQKNTGSVEKTKSLKNVSSAEKMNPSENTTLADSRTPSKYAASADRDRKSVV